MVLGKCTLYNYTSRFLSAYRRGEIEERRSRGTVVDRSIAAAYSLVKTDIAKLHERLSGLFALPQPPKEFSPNILFKPGYDGPTFPIEKQGFNGPRLIRCKPWSIAPNTDFGVCATPASRVHFFLFRDEDTKISSIKEGSSICT